MRLGNGFAVISRVLPLLFGILCLSGSALPRSAQAQATPPPSVNPQSASQATPQPGQPAAGVPLLQATTHEVLLDVVVTDSAGHPVTGLTASDFSVTEEGSAERLTHLEEHRPMTDAQVAQLKAGQALPPNIFTNYLPVQNTNASTVILLDAMDTPIGAQMELRQQLIDYLKHMTPGTPIAIFQVDTEMRLIQGFSADPQVLLDAARSKRDMPSLSRPGQGNSDVFRRARLDTLRSGFRLLGRYLAGFPGRKNLIWFTGNIPEGYRTHPLESSFGRSFRDEFSVIDEDATDLTDALTLSRVAVYPIDARGLETPPQYDVSIGGRPSPRIARHFDTSRSFQHMDLEQIAEQTGGRAYVNTNGFKEAIEVIVSNGSSYYTLSYATTNDKWEGQFRRIKVALSRSGLHAQYRQGYYAIDRTKQEQRLLAAMARKKARDAAHPFGDSADDADKDAAEGQEAAAATPSAPDAAAGQASGPTNPANPASPGALVPHPKGGFEASMQLGAIPPTEIILTAKLTMDDKVEKLQKSDTLPEGNYLQAEWKGKPFRTYTVQIKADARALRLTKAADGKREGSVEFVTVVYDQTGHQVNSLLSHSTMRVNEATYRQMLAIGVQIKQQIAIPVKGNYFLRIGVHDVASDHIGALEIPVDEVHPVAGTVGQ